MKRITFIIACMMLYITHAYSLEIPKGKFYFDNSKTNYSQVKFIYGSNTREECYVVSMTHEEGSRWSVTIPATVSDMYRYTFADTSLPDGNMNQTFNTVKDNISNQRGEYRTATSEQAILVGGIFVPSSGDNWAQGSWQSLNPGKPYSGTLPVLYINTSTAASLPECCTYVDGYYFAYFENSQNWEEVGCYVWDDSYQTIAGGWPGETCELVGTNDKGNQIWRWKSNAPSTSLAAPKYIIFNNNQSTGGQTADLVFANGGYYTYKLGVQESPEITITESGAIGKVVPITSKETYVQGTYYIDALGLEGYESLGSKEAPLGLQIKGRGNYTWKDFDKKPYRVKLDDKASPLGMKKSKHFTLLAHADDNLGFLRNTVGFQLSRLLGLAYTPEQRPVEVILNGDYIGLYMITDKLRVDKNRVNIVEQADNETDPANITGGWLLEIDNYEEEGQIRITEGNGKDLRFTYHTPEVLSNEQTAYITNLLTATDNAIYNTNKNSTEWENYIDIDALARFYIIQEIMDNAESFHGSCYLHKERGENTKFVFGPVWDFGNSYHRGFNKFIYVDPPFGQSWIGEIAKYPRFQECVKSIWRPFLADKYPSLDSFIDDFISEIAAASVSDVTRWPSYGNRDISGKKSDFKNKMRQKVEFLTEQWGGPISGIQVIQQAGNQHDEWLTINGQRLNGKPTQQGIYLHNNKKVVVR